MHKKAKRTQNEAPISEAMEAYAGDGALAFHTPGHKQGLGAHPLLKKLITEAGHYDVILMDIQMPNMDGLRATQHIRRLADKARADIPIIAMTANAFDEDKNNAFKAGMNGFVPKPIELENLFEELERIL